MIARPLSERGLPALIEPDDSQPWGWETDALPRYPDPLSASELPTLPMLPDL